MHVIFWMTMPAVLALFAAMAALVRLAWKHQFKHTLDQANEDKHAMVLRAALPAVLEVAFLFYPMVSSIAFQAFSCYEFADSDSRGWLIADVAITCGTAEHASVKRVSWTAVMLYPVGLLVLNAALLIRARHSIRTGQKTPLSTALDFLYREYKPQVHDPMHVQSGSHIGSSCLLLRFVSVARRSRSSGGGSCLRCFDVSFSLAFLSSVQRTVAALCSLQ